MFRHVSDFLRDWERSFERRQDAAADEACGWVPADLPEDDLMRCVEEAERRGLAIDRRKAETAYDALLRGQSEAAARYLRHALFPDGGADLVAARIAPAVTSLNNRKGRVS